MKKNDIIHVPADRIVIGPETDLRTYAKGIADGKVTTFAKMKDGDIELTNVLHGRLPIMLASVFRIQIDDAHKRVGRILAYKDKDGTVGEVGCGCELYNNNCLEGMRCPQCGSLGPFKITVTTVLVVDDEGIDDEGIDKMWDSQSRCECKDCYNVGTAADFHEEPHDADDWTISE